MAKQPYEVLLRFDENGKKSGGHVVMADIIDGKQFPSGPESVEGIRANTALAEEVKDYCAVSLILAEADLKAKDDIIESKDTEIADLKAANEKLIARIEAL